MPFSCHAGPCCIGHYFFHLHHVGVGSLCRRDRLDWAGPPRAGELQAAIRADLFLPSDGEPLACKAGELTDEKITRHGNAK